MLITDHLQPAVAQVLLQRGVSYLDAAGNAHIEQGPLLLHIEGRKRIPRPREAPIRALSGEGLKVIFVLVLEPSLVTRPYRDLAALSGASHGVVQYVMHDLERLGFLLRLSRTERRLHSLDGLLERWTTGFAETLRPKLVRGTFRPSDPGLLDPLDGALGRWGGEQAAAAVTGYLQPATSTLYSRRTRADLVARLRLLPDPHGRLDVLDAFWPERLEADMPAAFVDNRVPDLLTYADLIASEDPRNARAAALLRQRLHD